MYSNIGKEIKSPEQPDGDESLSTENTAYKAINSFNDEHNVEIFFSPQHLKMAVKNLTRNIDSPPASYLNDEYNRDIDISPQQMKIAIKTVYDFVSPYKQAIVDTLAAGFHSIADAMIMVHMSGVHVQGPLKYLGPFFEVVSEILHNPSGELMERLVCGSTVGLVKEAVNITVAVESGVAVGLLSSVGTTPAGGIATMGVVVVGAYKMANKITTPLGHMIQHKCHTMFKNSDHEKRTLTENPKQRDVSTSKMANILAPANTDPTDLYLSVINQQTQSINQLLQSPYPIPNPVPDSINPFATTRDSGMEHLQHHLTILRQTNPSLNETGKALTSSPSLTEKISEHLQNLANSQNSFHRTLASSHYNNFSQFTTQSPPVWHFNTASEADRYRAFFSNYIAGDFCVIPPKSQDFSFFGGGASGSGGKNGYCDNRFGNCSGGSSGSDNCRDSGSGKCESKFF